MGDADFYVYENNYANHNGLSLEKTGETIPAMWKEFAFEFTAKWDGEFFIRFDVDSVASVLFKDISVSQPDYFDVETAWRSYDDDRFVIQDYRAGQAYNACAVYKDHSLMITPGGVLFLDKGKTFTFPAKPVRLAFNDYGLWVVTEKAVFLMTGLTALDMTRTQMLSYGLEKENFYGFDAWSTVAVMFNDTSVFLFYDDSITDIGKAMEPYISELTGNKYAAIEEKSGSIWIPVKPDAVKELQAGSINMQTGYGIYDLNTGSWRIYAYNGAISGNFVKFSGTFNHIIGNVASQCAILEAGEDYARDVQGYQNESWDDMLCRFITREMSFDNAGYMKKIRWAELSNVSIRDQEDLALPDYYRFAVYQNFNPYGENQSEVESFEETDYNGTYPEALTGSWKAPLKCNIYSGTVEIVIARTSDQENPKLILKDLLLEVWTTSRSRRGGY